MPLYWMTPKAASIIRERLALRLQEVRDTGAIILESGTYLDWQGFPLAYINFAHNAWVWSDVLRQKESARKPRKWKRECKPREICLAKTRLFAAGKLEEGDELTPQAVLELHRSVFESSLLRMRGSDVVSIMAGAPECEWEWLDGNPKWHRIRKLPPARWAVWLGDSDAHQRLTAQRLFTRARQQLPARPRKQAPAKAS